MRKDAFANNQTMSLKDSNFMIAFALEDYFSYETYEDPMYLKWVAYNRVAGIDGYTSREIPIFPCRDEDYAKFYPVDESSKPKLQ